MKAIETETLPAPPSLISALLAGFDSITTHISLIIFPILLDILFWFGPHLGVKSLVETLLNQMTSLAGTTGADNLAFLKDNLKFFEDHFNLLTALRSYPVGIPSLMARILPVTTPFLSPYNLDIKSVFVVIGLWLLLTFVGIALGSLYFVEVASASVNRLSGASAFFKEWFRATTNVLLLSLICVALLLGVSVPATCIISALALGGTTLLSIGYLLFGAAVIWLMFPLVLSPHGIFVNRDNFLSSLKNSVRITRMTLPTTGLLLLSIVVISQGLDLLWSRPDESTWFALVGIAGHAFITTGLLAASFVYYRDADRWVKAILKSWSENSPAAKLRM